MNLFSLSLKSDKDLQQFLNSGKIENEISEEQKQNEKDNNDKSNSNLENLIDSKEKLSIGISGNISNINKEENKKENSRSNSIVEEEQDYHERHESMVLENKRSLFHKIFGPMEAGSIRGSIFNMVILSLGTGMLALPKYMENTSLVFAVILIIVICIIVWWSLLLLSKACEKNNIYNYSKLILTLYGKGMSYIYDAIVILYSFGVLILFNCIIFSTLSEALFGIYFFKEYTTIEDFQKNSFWNEWYIKWLIPYGSSIIIVYPMCLIKDVSKLRIISLIGVINIIGLIFILIYQSKDYITLENLENNVNYFDFQKGFSDKFDTLNFITCIFYAACFHIGCVPVINTLTNNVRRRIYKAIRRTIIIDIFFYTVIAVIGYLTWPKGTPSLIIQRPPLKEKESDFVMGIGKIGLVFTFFTKLPNTYSSLRITLFDKLWGTTEITNTKNYIVTFIVIMVCVTCSILYSEISSYIKIMGGLFSTLVGFLFPSLLIVRANKRKRYHWKNILTLLFFIFLTLIGFISSGLTIYEIFFESKKK